DEDAEQHAAEIIAVGNGVAEEIAQQHREEDVGGDEPDEDGGDELDAVDEAVHGVAGRVHALRHTKPLSPPRRERGLHAVPDQYCALNFTSSSLRAASAFSGSTPAFLAPSAHFADKGSTAFRQSASCSAEIR